MQIIVSDISEQNGRQVFYCQRSLLVRYQRHIFWLLCVKHACRWWYVHPLCLLTSKYMCHLFLWHSFLSIPWLKFTRDYKVIFPRPRAITQKISQTIENISSMWWYIWWMMIHLRHLVMIQPIQLMIHRFVPICHRIRLHLCLQFLMLRLTMRQTGISFQRMYFQVQFCKFRSATMIHCNALQCIVITIPRIPDLKRPKKSLHCPSWSGL